MSLPIKIVWAVVAALAAFTLIWLSFTDGKEKNEVKKPQEEAVVDKAFHTKDLSTFVTAIKTAKLQEQLSSQTPITIFAPNDSAFSSLPDGKFAELMNKKNVEELKEIINYHVVAGYMWHSDLENGQILETLQGDSIKISLADDQILMNGTKLVRRNIEASNGIIHVIDGVMMPYADKVTAKR